jgi:hypothetical protein
VKYALIAAVNDRAIFESSLAASPDTRTVPVYPMEGFTAASRAYNAGMNVSTEDMLIFVHQDVYLPPGWMDALKITVKDLTRIDPNWAVLGVIGIDLHGRLAGRAYSTGIGKIVGKNLDGPVPAQSLDEIVLIVRRDSGVRFDLELPGFHLYGTDICMTARAAGLKCYVIEAFCIHNSRGIRLMPSDFWNAYRYLARKWADHCPIRTPCTILSPGLVAQMRQRWYDLRRHVLRGSSPGHRVADPAMLYHDVCAKAGGGRHNGFPAQRDEHAERASAV